LGVGLAQQALAVSLAETSGIEMVLDVLGQIQQAQSVREVGAAAADALGQRGLG
jgi:hypothetical protein